MAIVGAVVALVAVAVPVVSAQEPAAEPATHGFLARNGKQLTLDGVPFTFVGVNAFGLSGCDGASTDTSEAGLDSYFASLRPHSVTRTWAFKPQGLAAIDKVVKSAEKNNQLVIFALADGANFCNDGGHDAAFYAQGGHDAYLDWIRTVVPKYKDSTAVAMWELLNEPKGASSDQVMKTFFDEAAGLIKSLDPHHLVSTGSQAPYVAGTGDYAYVHGGPDIDVGSLHEYDWDTSNHQIVSGWFAKSIAGMNAINKPLYIGESGVAASDSGGCSSRQERADAFKQKFDGYLGGGAVGVLAWNYRTTKVDTCDYTSPGTIYPGDPLMATIKAYQLPTGGAAAPSPSPSTGTPSPAAGGASPTPGPTSPSAAPTSSGPAATELFDEGAYTYTGTWQLGTGTGKFQGDDRYTGTAGAEFRLTFTGTRIALYASVAPHHGLAAISMDGGSPTTVDYYAATRAEQKLVYTSPVLKAGKHTITVRALGTHNPRSTGTVVTADRAVVTK